MGCRLLPPTRLEAHYVGVLGLSWLNIIQWHQAGEVSIGSVVSSVVLAGARRRRCKLGPGSLVSMWRLDEQCEAWWFISVNHNLGTGSLMTT